MNPFEMMKNLGNIKEQLQQAQSKLEYITATGSAGGNMVKVTLNGNFEIENIELDPICVDNRDVPMLQDLIKAAHHAAIENLKEQIKNEMGPMFANLNIPGMS
ncbi:MAG: YbaB/EbfC family nucleoid-associated protein [Treponema sp.]|nr:YbaB/EbfC family nucleoid-associated protein [Treponema sp.]MBQ2551903.1 YbaB/EbfC family nucleoid-associated protein [Treponema sp.]MBQ4237020.1 YbaB/EbfC family nucleoid-associated protein [Treponema sp.]MBQ5384021.1 YbaB/EbfC family nucleoid-associated protein [Treponema sp.]